MTPVVILSIFFDLVTILLWQWRVGAEAKSCSDSAVAASRCLLCPVAGGYSLCSRDAGGKSM